MPTRSEFAERRNQAKTELVRRVAAGESITAVCAAPHMPNRMSVARWAKTDVTFANEIAMALRRCAWIRHEGFDETRAGVVLARFAAGETLFAICCDPAMPSLKQLAYWRATQGHFGGEIFRLLRDKRAERTRANPHNAPRLWTEAEGDRVLAHVGRGHNYRRLRRIDPSLPGGDVIERWRRQHPEFDHAIRIHQKVGRCAEVMRRRRAAALEILRDGIIQGGSIQSLGGKRGLPCAATLYTWTRRYPDFARQVAEACDWRQDWYTDQMQVIADEAGAVGVGDLRKRMSPLARQLGRLGQRPGMRRRG